MVDVISVNYTCKTQVYTFLFMVDVISVKRSVEATNKNDINCQYFQIFVIL